MKISEQSTDHHYHLGIIFPDKRFSVKDLKKLTPQMDQTGLDYTKSYFAPNDAIFENFKADSPEKTLYRVTHKFMALSHNFVQDLQFEAFCKIAETFVPMVTDTLKIPTWLNQECIVQKLAPCPRGGDSRAFLGQSILRLQETDMQGFERKPACLGIRLVFPADKDSPVEFEVKVESFVRDTTRLFLQVHARFLQPLPTKDPKLALGCLRKTKQFLEERVFPFVEGRSL